MKGSYILLIKLNDEKLIQVGKLGKIFFEKGYYAYIGSALNNLEKRIQRHLKEDKKIHWHIDYFLKNGKITDVFYKENIFREECSIADKFKEIFTFIPHFGCSDCKCKSHLFYGEKKEIINIVNSLNCKKMIIN